MWACACERELIVMPQRILSEYRIARDQWENTPFDKKKDGRVALKSGRIVFLRTHCDAHRILSECRSERWAESSVEGEHSLRPL